ncbi:MAG: MlaD family protein [Pseudomonadota bacterium]
MSSPRRAALALRLGGFVLGGALLALVAVALLVGGWLQRTEAVEMSFRGSVQGLHTGAPVVLRGVPVGYVTAIGLSGGAEGLVIPVRAQIRSEDLGGATLASLLEGGLVARLATRSLLSGQLHVELDLRPEVAAEARRRMTPAAVGRLAIPTAASWQQGVQEQIEALDLRQLSADLGATLTSVRLLMQSPELKRTLAGLADTSERAARVAAQLEQRLPALAARADGTLASAGLAADRIGAAAERGARAAQQIGAAASGAPALLAPDAALARSVRRAADELAAGATALRAAAEQAEPTLAGTERALDEVARASRAVRELAELLERDPQVLLRGKRGSP